jgi:hypothetical protein
VKIIIEIDVTVEGRKPTQDEVAEWAGKAIASVILSEDCGAGEAFALLIDSWIIKLEEDK